MELTLVMEILAVLLALLYFFAIYCALEAILKARTSQGAIAWTISLITFPYVSLPIYLVFGRNKFDGYLEKRLEMETETQKLMECSSASISQHAIPTTQDKPLYNSLYALVRMPAVRGNAAQLLIDGNETFDSIASHMEQAQNYILFQFYIIRDDDLGRRLGRVMAERAKAGVKVFLLYDEIGSRPFGRSRLLKQLRMTGVQAVPFNTTQGRRRNRFQLNFRNHRKIVVVDGEQAWIGGHNVGDEYLGLKKSVGHWRDTHVRIEGPAVIGVQHAFATDWLWATRTHLDVDWKFSGKTAGDCEVLVFPSDPASDYEEAGLMFHQAIVAARRRIWIASPYFVPDNAIISALQLAALRGVDVRLIIPDEPDGPVVGMANWSFTRQLLPPGVKIFRYQGGFMHQKVLLMDDILSGIGTANFDNRSFRLNFEITLLIHSGRFATEVEAMLERDMSHSRQVEAAEIENKPRWFRLGMAAARLCAPIL